MAIREVKYSSSGPLLACETCLPAKIILAASPALVVSAHPDLEGFIDATITGVTVTCNRLRVFTIEYDDTALINAQMPLKSTDIIGLFCIGLREDWIIGSLRDTVDGFISEDRNIFTTAPLMGGGNLSSDLTLSMPAATTAVSGYLTFPDWNIFNNKVPPSRQISTVGPLQGGGNLSADLSLSIPQASAAVDGFLSAVDFTVFNAKVSPSRNIFTTAPILGGGDLSADRTISLANTAVTPGSYTFTSLTVDAQGRLTAASNGTLPPPVAPGGANTQVQFNDSGAFGGDAGFTFAKATDTVSVIGFAEGVRLILTHTGAAVANIFEMRNSGSAVMTAFSPVGYLVRGTDIFLHDFGASNSIFLGVGAGNQTASGAHNNIGIGSSVMGGLSGTASGNTVVGSVAASALTTGTLNTVIGSYAAADLTTGSSNTIIGSGATWVLTTGSQNTVIGAASIGANVTGATAIGHGAQLANSYTMILGSPGVNSPLVSVGGDPAPAAQLHVRSRSATTPTSIFRAFLAQSVNNTEWQTSTNVVVASMNALGQLTVTPGGNVVTYDRTISTTAPLTGGGDLSANRTFGLANTAVTPGSYTSTNLTVDAQGRITAASDGGAGGVPSTRLINTTGPLVGGGDLSADRTISIPAATTSVSGYLTSTDWNIFNNKQATIGPFTAGSVIFSNGTILTQDNAGLFYDNSNNWLGVNTNTPIRPLHVRNSAAPAVSAYQVVVEAAAAAYGAGISFQSPLSGAGALTEMARITADGEANWDATAANQDAGLRFWTTENGVPIHQWTFTSAGVINKLGTRFIAAGPGSYSLFVGVGSGNATLTSPNGYNTGLGGSTLVATTTADMNTAVGARVLQVATTGGYNTGVGAQSLQSLVTGTQNTTLGWNAGGLITSSSNNVCVGYAAGASANGVSTGIQNTFLGANTAFVSTTQFNKSVALGYSALIGADSTCVIGGTAASTNALKVVIGGTTAAGQFHVYAESAVTVAEIIQGFASQTANLTDWRNSGGVVLTAIDKSGYIFRGTTRFLHDYNLNNVFLGLSAGNFTTAGSSIGQNIGIGGNALLAISDGYRNTAVGHSAAYQLTTGHGNTAIGSVSLGAATTAISNTALGYSALGALTTGTLNVGLGFGSGALLTTGNYNTFVGCHSGLFDSTQYSNSVAIGYGAKIGADKTCSIGGTQVSGNSLKVVVNGIVANAQLHVNVDAAGNVGQLVRGFTSQTADLVQLQDVSGFIKALFDKQGRPTFANTTPTIAAGAAAGTGPSVSIVGSDVCGVIQVTTGSAPSTGGNIVRVTFSTPYGNVPKAIIVTPANSMTSNIPSANIPYVNASGATTSYFDFNVATSGTLNAATAYVWYYLVIG